MNILSILLPNIIPLYILVALGYYAGKRLDVNLPSMAALVINIVGPYAVFGSIAQMTLRPDYMTLPFIVMAVSATSGLLFYNLAKRFWHDHTANLIGLASTSGNTGYFGLPIILALFGPEWAGIYLFMNTGLVLTDFGLGYYLGARGHADVKGALMRVAKLPILHGAIIGLVWNLTGLPFGEVADRFLGYAFGTWTILGMMMIGVALSKQSKLDLDIRLMKWVFAAKFIAWPGLMALAVSIDHFVFHALPPEVHQMMLIFSCVPLAANLTAFSANLNLHPEKAAGAVLVSTLLGIITVPASLMLYQWLTL